MEKTEQFVMAYQVEQDRLRAMLPEGFTSLRPVLRINAEIRQGDTEHISLELNTPITHAGKRGWLNIAHWESPASTLTYEKSNSSVLFHTPFLEITYIGTGILGGCPAERDNDGCFYGNTFRPAEKIDANKEFCHCAFAWKFLNATAHGISMDSKSIPAIPTEPIHFYEKQALTAENAAAIPCEQILGAYRLQFQRESDES